MQKIVRSKKERERAAEGWDGRSMKRIIVIYEHIQTGSNTLKSVESKEAQSQEGALN